jgi:hypothetical protein
MHPISVPLCCFWYLRWGGPSPLVESRLSQLVGCGHAAFLRLSEAAFLITSFACRKPPFFACRKQVGSRLSPLVGSRFFFLRWSDAAVLRLPLAGCRISSLVMLGRPLRLSANSTNALPRVRLTNRSLKTGALVLVY